MLLLLPVSGGSAPADPKQPQSDVHSEKNRRRRSSWHIDSYACQKKRKTTWSKGKSWKPLRWYLHAPFTHFPTAPFQGTTAMFCEASETHDRRFHETDIQNQSWSFHMIQLYSIHTFIYSMKTRKWSDSNGSKGFTVFPGVPPNSSLFEAGIRKNRKDFCMESWAGNVRLRRKLMLDELKCLNAWQFENLLVWEYFMVVDLSFISTIMYSF